MEEVMKLEKITPRKAEQYLNRNNSNRALRAGVVERYAKDMANGKWSECIAPIVFYDDGDLADGQHRLFAIVESGVPQKFYVRRNLPRGAGLNIDMGMNRSLVDNARIAGVDAHLNNVLLAVTRCFATGARSAGGKGNAVSNTQKLAWVDKYREPCEWAIHHGPVAKGIRNALTYTAIARAYSHMKDEAQVERLKEFCKVLQTGVSNGEADSAAVAIRNYLISNRMLAYSPGGWYETFKKLQNAISYFMRRKPLNVIKAVAAECYPDPWGDE